MTQIEPLTFNELRAFPLPKYLESLPNVNLQEFLGDENLIRGYVKELQTYKDHQAKILAQLKQSEAVLEDKILNDLIKKYAQIVEKITQQMNRITSLYQEFRNLEMYQYQLLSSNFNRDFLIKNKFGHLIEKNNQESIQLVKDFHSKVADESELEPRLNELITNFRKSRQQYHLRKEKLNRWNEERVSGSV
ncbi:uncharacterized protein RJT20DRAFT_132421 [Scheffersomyces xylosifermentans]|uniref:uncharacterized protein n=1 Tax=Scheffersomyces xylosifermentans TaxID=1304137 RepID=UPI00315C4C21